MICDSTHNSNSGSWCATAFTMILALQGLHYGPIARLVSISNYYQRLPPWCAPLWCNRAMLVSVLRHGTVRGNSVFMATCPHALARGHQREKRKKSAMLPRLHQDRLKKLLVVHVINMAFENVQFTTILNAIITNASRMNVQLFCSIKVTLNLILSENIVRS